MTTHEGKARVTSPFGPRRHPITGKPSHHDGEDSVGLTSKVLRMVAALGPVVQVNIGYCGGRGNNVLIRSENDRRHPNALVLLRYQHLASTPVKVGQLLRCGDTVGIEGSTGDSTGSHCHFEVTVDGVPVDPSPWSGLPNAVGVYDGNNDCEEEDDTVKFKIYAPMDKPVSSQMVKEGVVAIKGNDRKLRAYNLAGDARMVREYTDSSMSQVFEAMTKEMQAHELMISTD